MSASDVLAGNARWHVERGDCLPWLATLPDRCVAHVITDPPFEAAAHTHQRRLITSDRKVRRAPIPFAPIDERTRSSVGHEIARLARRWALVFCQVEAANTWARALSPLRYTRTMVWVKLGGMPQTTGDRPAQGYESIVLAHANGRSSWNGGGRPGVFTYTMAEQKANTHEHPTQKPLALMLELVELFTDPGDVILDPFAGSGTTGVAALRLGRRFIGCELDPRYHATAIERLTAEERGSTLHAQRAGQTTIFDRIKVPA